MKIYDIDNLKKNGDTFDLTTRTFIHYSTNPNDPGTNNNIEFRKYKVQRGEEMRIDLVCNSIYGNIDNIDILLNINNISNPLNIKAGTEIFYPLADSDFFRFKEKVDKETTRILSDPNRSTKKDPDRQKYVDQNYSAPPTILTESMDQVTVSGNVLGVGNNLFNR